MSVLQLLFVPPLVESQLNNNNNTHNAVESDTYLPDIPARHGINADPCTRYLIIIIPITFVRQSKRQWQFGDTAMPLLRQFMELNIAEPL